MSLFGRGNSQATPIGSGASGVVENLESVLMSARQMEIALIQERKRFHALQEEMKNAQATYERLLKEARSKADDVYGRELQLKASLSKYQDHDRALREKLATLSAGYRKAMSELQHYKNSWAGVLQREREARMIIQDSQRTINRTSEIEQQNKALTEVLDNERKAREQYERHAKSYQQELQNALVRLHSAESKFAELSKEFNALQQTRKTLDQEVARIEKSMRERFEWETIREREKMKTEMEKESAVLLYHKRMEIEERFRKELQLRMQGEMTRRDLIESGLENEIRRLRNESADTSATAQLEVEGLRGRLHGTENLLKDTTQQLSDLKAQSAALQAKAKEAETHLAEQSIELLAQAQQGKAQERVTQLESQLAIIKAEADQRVQAAERALQEKIIADRSRSAERLNKSRKARKGKDSEAFRVALEAETERSKSLESALIVEKERFDRMSAELQAEVERLRSVYPLQDLLTVKEDEIRRIERQLDGIQPGTVLRTKAEAALKLHREQRERLQKLVERSEARIREQNARIEAARNVNTIEARLDGGLEV